MNTYKIGAPTIFVDADSCPVKEEIVELAARFAIDVVFVASYNHMMNEEAGQTWIYVDSRKEAADLYIMNHAFKGDVVVTQDIGLASTLLPRAVYVLSPRGILFEEKDIATALDVRYLKAKARKRGFYGKGPKPFKEGDRLKFIKEMTRILSKFAGK